MPHHCGKVFCTPAFTAGRALQLKVPSTTKGKGKGAVQEKAQQALFSLEGVALRGRLLGKGGENLRAIEARTGVRLVLREEGGNPQDGQGSKLVLRVSGTGAGFEEGKALAAKLVEEVSSAQRREVRGRRDEKQPAVAKGKGRARQDDLPVRRGAEGKAPEQEATAKLPVRQGAEGKAPEQEITGKEAPVAVKGTGRARQETQPKGKGKGKGQGHSAELLVFKKEPDVRFEWQRELLGEEGKNLRYIGEQAKTCIFLAGRGAAAAGGQEDEGALRLKVLAQSSEALADAVAMAEDLLGSVRKAQETWQPKEVKEVKLAGRWQTVLLGIFRDFAPERQAQFEEAWRKGLEKVSFSDRGWNYVLDLRRMVQVNLSTKRERAVRRLEDAEG